MNFGKPRIVPARDVLAGWGVPVGLFLLALAIRLPALGQFLTPDEFLWVDRSRNFLAGILNPAYVCESPVNHTGFAQAVGLACTLRTGHPGVTTMWTGSLGILLRYLADGAPRPLFEYVLSIPTNPLDARFIVPTRLPTVVLTSLWIVAVYWLTWRLFADRRVAVVAGLLLALDVFHAALSRVIHHDALATAFMTLSLLTALMYWGRQESRRWLAASGLLAGLAFLSKSPALFLNPFIAVMGLWSLGSRRIRGEALTWQQVLVTVGDGLLWFGCAAFAFVALWPAMWIIPLDSLRTIFVIGSKYASGGHAKGNYFLGTVSSDPGVLFYPVTWLLRSSPLAWLGLGVVAVRLAKPQISRSTNWQDRTLSARRFVIPPVGVLLVYVILFVAFMTLGEKKQDRYILPVYPILTMVAALGLVEISNAKSQISNFKYQILHWQPPASKRYYIMLTAVVLVQGALVVANYPYYFTYYNPLLGGMRGAERMVTIGWGEGLDLAADYLNRKPDAEHLRVSAWYQSTFAPYFKGEAISYSQEKGKALAGDYVVFYINQLQRRFPDDELFRYFETRYQPEKVIPLKGVDYVVIYPGPGIQHYLEDRVDENRRVYRGIAALLGWNWLDGADPNRPAIAAGEALPFRLYWEYLGKSPEEQFFFRLVGPDERTWAEATSRPALSEDGDPATWRQGQIITEEGELRVPAGTPPGEYRLQIGFYTQAPAVTEGELLFDLPPDEARVAVGPATQPAALVDLPIAWRQDRRLADLRLLGATLPKPALVANQPWAVDVYWEAEVEPETDYQAQLSLVDSDGQVRWTWAPAPLVSFYTTSLWEAGQVIRSQMTVSPTARTPGGEFDLVLTLLDSTGQPAGQATLGRVRVEGRARSFEIPSAQVPVGATVGDAMELVGFNLQSPVSNLHPGDEVAVALIWRALAPLEADYTITLQLLGPDGRIYGQRDAQPLEGAAPTRTWTPGEVLTDAYRLVVADDAPPGEYRLLVAVYRPETGQRLQTLDRTNQSADDKIVFPTIIVIPD